MSFCLLLGIVAYNCWSVVKKLPGGGQFDATMENHLLLASFNLND